MKWLLIIIVTFLPYSLQAIENNLTIFDRLTEQIVNQTITNVDLKQCTKIIIKNAELNDNNSWYIENWFIKLLEKTDHDSIALYRTSFNKDSTSLLKESSSAVMFEFKIIELKVDYISNNSFWKSKPLERRIIVELLVNIYNFSNGLLYWTGNIKKEYSDTIKMDQIAALQNTNIIFTQAAIPSPTGFKKILEPIFIMGVSGVIIYLFYSFRSK